MLINGTIAQNMSMFFSLFFLLTFALPVSAEVWTLSAGDWAKPRHGEWLVQHPALVAALGEVQNIPNATLQLRYPGGDEGVLWVEELQAWLMALGLESERIETLPGSGANAIQLEVIAQDAP